MLRTLLCTTVAAGALGVLAAPLAPADHATGRRVQLVDGHGVRWWAHRARENRAGLRWQRHRATRLRRLLTARYAPLGNEYERATVLAAIAYGVDAGTLLRKGRCESGGWTAFTNQSSGAAGPFQFLWSTWRSTPYAGFSPYDPLAAALAAAWMHRMGRGSEWSCQ